MINTKKIIKLFALDALLRLILFLIAQAIQDEYKHEYDGITSAMTIVLFATSMAITFIFDCITFTLFNKFLESRIALYALRPLISLFNVIIIFLLFTDEYGHWHLSKIGSGYLQLMRNTMIVSTISSLLSIVLIKK